MGDGTRPTPPSERIVSLDVLRGVALLGILLVNVQLFSMPELTLVDPTLYGDLTGANYWVWVSIHVLVEGKFITLFTFLFGAGVVLFTEGERSRWGRFKRRSAWLVVFGAAHAYLLWYGDILFVYGVCAFVVGTLRHRPTGQLVAIGARCTRSPRSSRSRRRCPRDRRGSSTSGRRRRRRSAPRSTPTGAAGWPRWITGAPASFRRQTAGLLSYSGWRVSGAMLFGMALFRSGVLTGDSRRRRTYLWLVSTGGTVGIAAAIAGVVYVQANDWSAAATLFWRQFNYWGALPLAAAYAGAVALYCRWRPDGIETAALAAVGRTALSNYVLQTVLATSVFYGHGLGLFGSVSRTAALGVVVAIWAVQIPLSVLWLRYARYGPLEWLWRVLTYGRLWPCRRE